MNNEQDFLSQIRWQDAPSKTILDLPRHCKYLMGKHGVDYTNASISLYFPQSNQA